MNTMKKLTLLLILVLFASTSRGQQNNNSIELNSNWEYTHFPYSQTDDAALEKMKSSAWKNATVPGDVHLDLQRDGVLPDLYYGLNFYASAWVEHEDFMYKTSFKTPNYDKGDQVHLDFEGLDCFATIWINGQIVGKTHNMFKTYSFEVSKYLLKNDNELIIRLAAPMEEVYKTPNAQAMIDAIEGCAFNVKERAITRKMQMSYGWDNVPRIITTGIFKPVTLTVSKAARIENVWFRTEHSDNYSKAKASIDVTLLGTVSKIVAVEVVLSHGEETFRTTKKIKLSKGKSSLAKLTLELNNPKLWWPAGLGEQPLYTLQVNLLQKDEVLNSHTEIVAIREVKVVTTPIEKRVVDYRIGNPNKSEELMDGGFIGAWSKVKLEDPKEVDVTPLKFYVNGRYVFIKGYAMQPLDAMPVSISAERYFRSVKAAKDSGSNMLRIWGGGNVENKAFYDACDQMGIMVWQDFFYASSLYPNDDAFLEEAEGETINIVKKLRNRACIVGWCGDNESDMVRDDKGKGQFSNKITHVIQKRVMAEYDPTRYWHPSSPSGGGYPRSPWGGDKRNWSSTFPVDDYINLRNDDARFISEGGTPAIPQMSSLLKFVPKDKLWPVLENDFYHMHWGDVPTMRRGFPQNIWKNVTGYFGTPSSISEYIYLSQVFQANGYTRMAQTFRSNMEECGGMLYWKWADTWPSVSMSVIDYNEFKKPSWYAIRNAFAPRTLMVKNTNDQLSVWYINDLDKLKNQEVHCKLVKTNGTLVKEWKAFVDFKENTAGLAIDLKTTRKEIGDGSHYLKVWVGNNETINPYYYTAADMKLMKITPSKLTATIKRVDASKAILTLTANEFTPFVIITTDNAYIQLSDNTFFMEKGTSRDIELKLEEGEISGEFMIQSWKGTTQKIQLPSALLSPVPMDSRW
jgi:beta-mannosidase